MYGITNDQGAAQTIREKAERKYGGTTTISKVTLVIKNICQKFQVGDLVTFAQKGSSTTVYFGAALERRLVSTRHYDFLKLIVQEVEDCGYSVAAGDDFLVITKA